VLRGTTLLFIWLPLECKEQRKIIQNRISAATILKHSPNDNVKILYLFMEPLKNEKEQQAFKREQKELAPSVFITRRGC
jgi:hypothetical protein